MFKQSFVQLSVQNTPLTGLKAGIDFWLAIMVWKVAKDRGHLKRRKLAQRQICFTVDCAACIPQQLFEGNVLPLRRKETHFRRSTNANVVAHGRTLYQEERDGPLPGVWGCTQGLKTCTCARATLWSGFDRWGTYYCKMANGSLLCCGHDGAHFLVRLLLTVSQHDSVNLVTPK